MGDAAERSRLWVAIRHAIPLDKTWRGEALDLIYPIFAEDDLPDCPDCGGSGIVHLETNCGGCSDYPGIPHEPACGIEPCPRGCEVHS